MHSPTDAPLRHKLSPFPPLSRTERVWAARLAQGSYTLELPVEPHDGLRRLVNRGLAHLQQKPTEIGMATVARAGRRP